MIAIEMLLFGYGIYLVYLYVKMKSSGEIPKGLISNKINLQRAKDIPGFIKYMYPRGIVFGLVLSIASFILALNEYVTLPVYFSLTVELTYFVAIVYFAVISIKAQNRFLI